MITIFFKLYEDRMDLLKSDKEPDELKRFNHNLKSFCRVNLMIDPQIVLERLSCEDFDSEEDYLAFVYKIHLIMDRRYTHQDQITDKKEYRQKILMGVLMYCHVNQINA